MILKAAHISCIRQQKVIFSDISFELSAGEMLLVQGENGSGKSSLLRVLAGLCTPHTGEIIWRHPSPDCLHYVGHDNGSKSGLTILENLELIKQLSRLSFDAGLTEILRNLQLMPLKDTLIKNLSAGQKRRAALARLFLFKKPCWILDEPLTALDSSCQEFFLSRLQKHIEQGGIAVVSSHHPIPLHQILIKNLRLTC
jgi:heme exporter protein A